MKVKINWKARFKNKAFLIAFFPLVISFVYQVLGLFDIVPSITEDSIVNAITIIINILATLGVVVDPTTKGVSDSERALTYYKKNEENEVE